MKNKTNKTGKTESKTANGTVTNNTSSSDLTEKDLKTKNNGVLNARINFSGKPIKNENILNKRIKFFNSVKPNL